MEGEEAGENVSVEGEGTEDARKVVVSEKEGNTTDLSGERIKESVGSPEDQVKLNTPVLAPYIIPSSSSSPPFFLQASNPSAEEAKGNVSGEGEVTEEERKVSVLENKGNTAASSGEVIVDQLEVPEKKSS